VYTIHVMRASEVMQPTSARLGAFAGQKRAGRAGSAESRKLRGWDASRAESLELKLEDSVLVFGTVHCEVHCVRVYNLSTQSHML
jgi:hypothetical protein